MTADSSAGYAAPVGSVWTLALQSLRRPYPLRISTAMLMALLVLMVPFYIFIAELMPGRALHAPGIALDRLLPLLPGWALVYGPLYLFLILLPLFVVRQEEQIRRTLLAYLAVWTTAYVVFLLYPTVAPRPAEVAGSGFAAWGLKFLYQSDPPFNCFPSLHVAHSFVSALTCRLVHRGLGIAAIGCAALVGVSTLFTKQHYVSDVIAGVALALVASFFFLRRASAGSVPALDRRAAPALAVGVAGVVVLVGGCFWIAYRAGM